MKKIESLSLGLTEYILLTEILSRLNFTSVALTGSGYRRKIEGGVQAKERVDKDL